MSQKHPTAEDLYETWSSVPPAKKETWKDLDMADRRRWELVARHVDDAANLRGPIFTKAHEMLARFGSSALNAIIIRGRGEDAEEAACDAVDYAQAMLDEFHRGFASEEETEDEKVVNDALYKAGRGHRDAKRE
jgi:hypothetical protein